MVSKHKILSLSAILICTSFFAFDLNAEDELQDLLKVENKVQSSVSKVMSAVVAVTDGQGFGSGVIVSEDGLVLTAGHVMASPYKRNYEVVFPDGHRAKAIPLGKNLNVDAGMVKIVEEGPFPHVDLAEAEAKRGDWVITLGHSGGYDLGRKPPVRTGRVLGKRDHQLITDAVLIGGDSGGPLFNLEGEVIGIHSSIGDSIAENRHVTIDTFKKYWTRMERGDVWGELPDLASKKKKKEVPRAKLGVVVDRKAPNALVKQIHVGSAAERAGLRVGDIITKFDGKIIENSGELIETIRTKRPGQGYSLEILRNGIQFRAEVVLDNF